MSRHRLLRARGAAEAHPVEMRFLDLFMAALGALVFLAMVLSFLVSLAPKEGDHLLDCAKCGVAPPPVEEPPPEIATLALPRAEVGEPFAFAIAYRGGRGPISWRIAAGESELPPEIKLDAVKGTLSGTATKPRTARFVVAATDARDLQAQQGFELVVAKSAKSRRWVERVLSVLVFLGALGFWVMSRMFVAGLAQRLQELESAHRRGEQQITIRMGRDEVEIIRLPGGIHGYSERLENARRFSAVVLVGVLLSLGWLVWQFLR